jgi:hypothetical protein
MCFFVKVRVAETASCVGAMDGFAWKTTGMRALWQVCVQFKNSFTFAALFARCQL